MELFTGSYFLGSRLGIGFGSGLYNFIGFLRFLGLILWLLGFACPVIFVVPSALLDSLFGICLVCLAL